MNIITISTVDDFQEVLKNISYDFKTNNKNAQETTWCLALEDNFARKVNVENFKSLFEDLIRKIKNKKFKKNLIFYVWFDKQALQLRFNVILGNSLSRLPFGCQIEVEKNLNNIVKDFIDTVRSISRYGDNVEIVNFDWDEEDEQHTLSVFCEIITSGEE